MALKRLDDDKLETEKIFYFDMLKHIGSKSSRISLVACFSSKDDSRML